MSRPPGSARRMWERLFELDEASVVVARSPQMNHWVESALGVAPQSGLPPTGIFDTIVVDLVGEADVDHAFLEEAARLLRPGRSRVWAFLFDEHPHWRRAQDMFHRAGYAEARLVEPSPDSIAIRLVPDPPPVD